MLSSKTVFVVGAGASYEVGLPIGTELKKQISTKLDLRFQHYSTPIGTGDLAIYESLQRKYQNKTNDYLDACWQIRDGLGLLASIDDFINTHQHEEKIEICGKLAIAKSILDAERNSKLFEENDRFDKPINFNGISDSWYVSFYQLLVHGVTKANIENIFDNVVVISFNYDRCIEHFLTHAIASSFLISLDESKALVRKLKIFHPYGLVGSYLGTQPIPYGSSGLPQLDQIVSTLKTYTEKIGDVEEMSAMRKSVFDASVLVFLGNAYHENNMNLLFDKAVNSLASPSPKRIYATRKGISEADLYFVRNQFNKIMGLEPLSSAAPTLTPNYLFADECRDLFSDYRLSLRQ